MNTKIERINNEIKKVKTKIYDYQSRLKELERQKTEAENTEIVMLVREIDVAPDELRKALELIKNQINASPSVTDGRKEKNVNEE